MKQHEANGRVQDHADVAAPRPRRPKRDARQWRALLDEHDGCGLSVAAFCRERDVATASFYHWRRLLRGGTDEAGEARRRDAAPRVVRLEALEADVDDAFATQAIVAELPGGARVSVPAGRLRELVDALLGRGPSC